MIKQLTIKNLAIIDDITIDFEDGFNVLTGETGAGKSIIIDALSLIFGARANNEIIAHGKESAFISVCLYLNDNLSKYIYDNYDIDVMDECIISRTLSTSSMPAASYVVLVNTAPSVMVSSVCSTWKSINEHKPRQVR